MNSKIDLWNCFDHIMPPGLTNSKMLNSLFAQAFLILTRLLLDCMNLNGAIRRARQGIEEGWNVNPPIPDYYLYPTFDSLIKFTMLLFLLMAILILSYSINHYAYYHRESKSIYVMHRLPSKWTIWKQCCTVPLIYAGFILLTAGIYYALFCAAYFHFAPEGVIPEQTIAFFWRYVP